MGHQWDQQRHDHPPSEVRLTSHPGQAPDPETRHGHLHRYYEHDEGDDQPRDKWVVIGIVVSLQGRHRRRVDAPLAGSLTVSSDVDFGRAEWPRLRRRVAESMISS